MDQIAAAAAGPQGMPGTEEYIALRLGRRTPLSIADLAAYNQAANDNAHQPARPLPTASSPATNSPVPNSPTTALPATNDNRPATPRPIGRHAPAAWAETGVAPAQTGGKTRIVNGRVVGMAGAAAMPDLTMEEFLQAADDYVRLGAVGLTGGYADNVSAGINAFFDMLGGANLAESFAANQAEERRRTDAARDRRGTVGTLVEIAPTFVPGIGDSAGLLADIRDFLENGDQWTAADWALVAAALVPGAPNRKTVKTGKKVVDDAKDKIAQAKADIADIGKKLGRPRTYHDMLPKQGNIFYSEGEARRLGSKLAPGENPLGMIFVMEKPTTKDERILRNQKEASGQAFDLETGDPYIPALRYLHDNGRDFIRFDGYEITDDGHVLLIDRKSNLTEFYKIQDSYKDTMERVRQSLEQNNKDAQGGALFRVAYDFDDEGKAREFEEFVRSSGFEDVVTVRVRNSYE
jgi:hypothetical protein